MLPLLIGLELAGSGCAAQWESEPANSLWLRFQLLLSDGRRGNSPGSNAIFVHFVLFRLWSARWVSADRSAPGEERPSSSWLGFFLLTLILCRCGFTFGITDKESPASFWSPYIPETAARSYHIGDAQTLLH